MKLSNSKRTFVIAAAAILMCAYQLSPTPTWACTAATSDGFAHASNTSATSVTVCAKSVTATRTVAVVKKALPVKAPAAKPAPKPVTVPVKVVSVLSPIKVGVPAALKKPVVKPATKPAASTSSTKTPTKSTAATASSATATEVVSFSPAPLSLSASATRAAVGQEVGFWSNASTHYKTSSLLGKVTEVRFTPIRTKWSSDEGHSGSSGSISLAFDKPGNIELAATVTFAVAYQIAGAAAWVSSGEISVSDSIAILIEPASETSAGPSSTVSARSEKIVRLVGENCLVRVNAFGCNP